MKTRSGFVSNSSSSSFVITNKSNKELDLVDFVEENPQLIERFLGMCSWYENNPEYTQENMIKSAKENSRMLFTGPNTCYFSDEDGTLIGNVLRSALERGGKSNNFEWVFVYNSQMDDGYDYNDM